MTQSETTSAAGGGETITILYTNWRGETAVRRIVPHPVPGAAAFWFGSTSYHTKPQWLVLARDADKGEDRDFALSGIKAWGQEAVSAALAAPTAKGGTEVPADPLVAYLERQWAWSKETFGPALRTKGIVQHITKELREIEADPHDLAEWVDVIILAMDGFWRHGGKPSDLLPAMQAKQDRNFARTWPDWRTMGEDQAIEHDRSGEASPPPPSGVETIRQDNTSGGL